MERKVQKISQAFQRWLLLVEVFAFWVTDENPLMPTRPAAGEINGMSAVSADMLLALRFHGKEPLS